MSAKEKENLREKENTCVVCFKRIRIYSIGICDHPVCFECSTRMRVLCKQTECPICRQDMPKVVFCKEVQPFRKYKNVLHNSYHVDRKYGMWFQNGHIQSTYYRLLEHKCKLCKNIGPFDNFMQLKTHMQREHELFYCDLCANNLRIFTWERKFYNRSELAQHQRKGDPDDTSHRGHPLCEFCDVRFMDNDELFRHLRREHFFCHFCDADGLHQYYPSSSCLRQHFKNSHYVCDEGECANEMFTSVFRTDIDLKAHRASVHGKYLSKIANKQARTLELEFTLAPRMRPVGYNTRKKPADRLLDEDIGALQEEPGSSQKIQLTPQDFPSLSGTECASTTNLMPPSSNVTIRHFTRGQSAPVRNNENFPALVADSSTVRFSVNSSSSADQPSSNVSIHVNHRPNGAITTHISSQKNKPAAYTTGSVEVRPSRSDAFPALGTTSSPPLDVVPQWCKPQKPTVSKVAPAPVLPVRNSATDFPSLTSKTDIKSKKSTSITVPMTNSWTNNHIHDLDSNKDTKNSKVKKKKSKNITDTYSVATSSNSISNNNKNNNNKTVKTYNDLFTSASTNSKKESSSVVTTAMTEDNNKFKQKPVKKRSELKIDSLQISESPPELNINHPEQFPALISQKPPPGFEKQAPLGFTRQAPPGFTANNLTFTNSSGQSYSILPQNESKSFYTPENFTQRNQKLVADFMNFHSSQESIFEFKSLSSMYRNGFFTAQQYYQHCKNIMKEYFPKIFPELLVLLPDINKQRELYDLFCRDSVKNRKGLEVCAVCSQVISTSDREFHASNHTLENYFSNGDSEPTNLEK